MLTGKKEFQSSFRNTRAGLALAIVTGSAGYAITWAIQSPLLDPLLAALILGIALKSSIPGNKKFGPGVMLASSIFIPVGIVFYGLHNLNFAKLTEVAPVKLLLLIVVMVVYFTVIIFLGKLLKLKKQITFLTAAGSAICGASAIAVVSPAVEAEPDDVSISLLSVALSAFIGFALVLPFTAALFDLTCNNYCFMSGATLQFTGLVKVASKYAPFLSKEMQPDEMLSFALSIKAVRYLGLLVAIPLLSSFVKNKLTAPWFLWAFLAAGLLGTWLYTNQKIFFQATLAPYIQFVHTFSWSIAMSAIGLNADVKGLLSYSGSKSLIVAFTGFIAATAVFLAGLYFIN
ncbi:MAG: putative sulfate exporter family transporter [Nitrospiraceae bacterium]|nr:MAG: putative sulfate exporter family transporter [Nitrospiraceae bacterium]